MRKALFTALASICIIGSIGASGFYPATMEIVNVENDVVTLEDATGNLWEFDGAEDYETGDLVSLIMYNSGTTDSYTDDTIISCRYSGYWK